MMKDLILFLLMPVIIYAIPYFTGMITPKSGYEFFAKAFSLSITGVFIVTLIIYVCAKIRCE